MSKEIQAVSRGGGITLSIFGAVFFARLIGNALDAITFPWRMCVVVAVWFAATMWVISAPPAPEATDA